MFSHLSVLATHDFTPILLTRYIQCLHSADNEPLVSKLVSVVLVGSQRLYKVSRFRKDVRIGLQTALMKNYPDILMDHASELQACQEYSYQFLFNFLLRNEAVQCDTIKLDTFLLLLSDMSLFLSHEVTSCDVRTELQTVLIIYSRSTLISSWTTSLCC